MKSKAFPKLRLARKRQKLGEAGGIRRGSLKTVYGQYAEKADESVIERV